MQTQVYHVKGLDCADCASVIKVDLENYQKSKKLSWILLGELYTSLGK